MIQYIIIIEGKKGITGPAPWLQSGWCRLLEKKRRLTAYQHSHNRHVPRMKTIINWIIPITDISTRKKDCVQRVCDHVRANAINDPIMGAIITSPMPMPSPICLSVPAKRMATYRRAKRYNNTKTDNPIAAHHTRCQSPIIAIHTITTTDNNNHILVWSS